MQTRRYNNDSRGSCRIKRTKPKKKTTTKRTYTYESKQTNGSFTKMCVCTHTYNDFIQGLLTLNGHLSATKQKSETERYTKSSSPSL